LTALILAVEADEMRCGRQAPTRQDNEDETEDKDAKQPGPTTRQDPNRATRIGFGGPHRQTGKNPTIN